MSHKRGPAIAPTLRAMDSKSRVMQAIKRAVAASGSSRRALHVCVISPDDEDDIISFTLGSYKEVQKLTLEIKELGYELKLMHPVHKQCDFVLEPHLRA